MTPEERACRDICHAVGVMSESWRQFLPYVRIATREAYEEAARVAEEMWDEAAYVKEIAAAIRAMKGTDK